MKSTSHTRSINLIQTGEEHIPNYPKAALMQFLESAYVGAAKKAGWDMEALKANVY